MNGDDDRRQRKGGRRPALDGASLVPTRPRKVKPPPGIITAGGVDMARAHASGIEVRGGAAPEATPNQPRVVLAVETDPRKVPTHRRLLEGREPAEDGARAAMLPVGSPAVAPHVATNPSLVRPGPGAGAPPPSSQSEGATTGAPPPNPAPPGAAPAANPPHADRREQKLPLWMRAAFILVLLVSTVGLVQRFRPRPAPSDDDGSRESPAREPAVTAESQATAPPPAPERPAPSATVVEAPRAPTPSGKASAPPTSERRPAGRPPPRATAAFTPPFQIPSEKN
jgi:hypothetical protein